MLRERGCPASSATAMGRWPQRLMRRTVIALVLALVTLALHVPVHAREIIHEIKPGDNLTRVAQKYNVDPAHLAAYNELADPNHIELGQSLRIPPVEEKEDSAADRLFDEIAVPAAVALPAEDAVGEAEREAAAPEEAAPVEAHIDETEAAKPALTTQDDPSLPGVHGYHMVVAGDSLSAIALRYGLTTDDLMRLNGLTDPNHLLTGHMLRLTAKVSPMTSSSTAEPSLAATIYTVQEGDTLSGIAHAHQITLEQLLRDNGLPHAEFAYVGQRLRIEKPRYAPAGFDTSKAPANGQRKIVIDLSDQTLTAYQGGVVVMHTHVSTGKASTPTLIGEFAIYLKYESQRMTGPGYDLEGVPWVMYYDRDYAIHGAYWHNLFGVPTSHGCTNMRPHEAKALYEWADIGTPVIVQW